MSFLQKNNVQIGILVWFFWAIWHLPHPLENMWGKMLVLFAPLVVVPIVLEIIKDSENPSPFFRKIYKWLLPSALFFSLAYFFPQNKWAGIFSLPWLCFSSIFSIHYLILYRNELSHKSFINLSAFGFLFIGALWASFDRFGIRPLNFDPEIVFLTVAHFHYAGFILTYTSGWALDKLKQKWIGKTIAYGIISGVALVAIGIVNSHLGGTPKIEFIATWWMALSAISLACTHIYFSTRKNCPTKSILYWSLAALFLIAGMILAGLYGMRHIWAYPGLDIAWMRVLHGSANVFGFSLFSVLGWRNYFKSI